MTMNALIIYLISLFPINTETSTLEVCLSKEESKLITLINKYRKIKRLSSIPVSKKLTLVAQIHAKDLAEQYHFDPDGKCNPHSWSDDGNWSACCYTNDHKEAECMWNKPKEIAGYESQGYEIAYYSSTGASAEEGLAGWKKSKGHNPLLINSGTWKQAEWKAIGVGIYNEYAVVWFGQLADSEKPCKNS